MGLAGVANNKQIINLCHSIYVLRVRSRWKRTRQTGPVGSCSRLFFYPLG
jgi:hypothetical protein